MTVIEALLICQLFFCSDPESRHCRLMDTFADPYETTAEAMERRDQLHRSNAHPWRLDDGLLVHWDCTVEAMEE